MNRFMAQGFVEEILKIAASGGFRKFVPKTKMVVKAKTPKLGKTYTNTLPPTGTSSNEYLQGLKNMPTSPSEVSSLPKGG